MNLKLNKLKLWAKLRDPDYRNSFVSSTVAARLAVRIFNLRKRADWSQSQLAEKTGMKQARISVLEQGDYENFTFSTLKKIAAAFNIAVVVDLVSFPNFIEWSDSFDSDSLIPKSFEESDAALAKDMRGAADAAQAIAKGTMEDLKEAAKYALATFLPPKQEVEDLLKNEWQDSGHYKLSDALSAIRGQTKAQNGQLLLQEFARQFVSRTQPRDASQSTTKGIESSIWN